MAKWISQSLATSKMSKPSRAEREFAKFPASASSTVQPFGEKRKGRATIRLTDGRIRDAEIHWYEASGIGKREFKIKRYLD